jgi:hypothetical protein
MSSLLWFYPVTMVIIYIYYIIHMHLLGEFENNENGTCEEREVFLPITQKENTPISYDTDNTYKNSCEDSCEDYIVV